MWTRLSSRKADVPSRFPEIGFASYPSAHYTASNWNESERGKADVASEARKLADYVRRHALGSGKLD